MIIPHFSTSSLSLNKMVPPGFVSNLEEVLLSKKKMKNNNEDGEQSKEDTSDSTEPSTSDSDSSKPVVLVTNGDGIESPGLVYLVKALVNEGLYNVHVCAPQSDKSVSGHSVTLQETIAVNSAEINGATAYEVSGTPVDCVSLALSGALFSWSKPVLVISGINRGSSCGHHTFYSGVVAGAREALICGVPSLSISLNWKKDESQESDFKDAVTVCLPLINAAIRDIKKGVFPKSCSLNIDIPTAPLTNKGFKFTKQSMWRSTPTWLAVSANRHPAGAHFMSNQQSLGIQLAQLSRDASAAGAARRITTQKKNVEIESVGVAGKPDTNQVKKFFRLEFLDKEQEDTDEDLDFRALENGFVAVTLLSLKPQIESDTQAAASEWILTALNSDEQSSTQT
ncbi:5'-nucleotidase SurE-like isoform X1 [Mangifera indica]|uniref:5'-nucleotidase SurE-like isoform X1 n=2 Tax=Mangifera indica TaxID=29780 RepID=UPI001CF9D545|nr:5'-nucleotidase SurE-like isoform X1 [Mangifera indica]